MDAYIQVFSVEVLVADMLAFCLVLSIRLVCQTGVMRPCEVVFGGTSFVPTLVSQWCVCVCFCACLCL